MGANVEEKKGKEKKVEEEVITAIYKVNLHCPQCANDIKRPLLRTQGVYGVETDLKKSEVKVKGVIDVIAIHKLLEKWSKKKVELVSPKIKIKEETAKEEKVVKEKDEIVHTTSMKINMHCDQCENDLRRKLLKHKDIYSVKTDLKAQTLTIQGAMEPEKLLAYIRKKANRKAEIIKTEQKVLKKEKEKPKPAPEAKVSKEKPKPAPESKVKETVEIVEFEKKAEIKTKESNQPYFIHYVYAPQLFSDENPNACIIM